MGTKTGDKHWISGSHFEGQVGAFCLLSMTTRRASGGRRRGTVRAKVSAADKIPAYGLLRQYKGSVVRYFHES